MFGDEEPIPPVIRAALEFLEIDRQQVGTGPYAARARDNAYKALESYFQQSATYRKAVTSHE